MGEVVIFPVKRAVYLNMVFIVVYLFNADEEILESLNHSGWDHFIDLLKKEPYYIYQNQSEATKKAHSLGNGKIIYNQKFINKILPDEFFVNRAFV